MRTTLTLDDDVAALLTRIQEARKETLKEVVNTALRKGLTEMDKPTEPRKPFKTRVIATGERALPNLDNIGEVIAWLEGEDHK